MFLSQSFRCLLLHTKVLGIFFCLTLLCPNGYAEVYKWVDSKGKVHLSDKRAAPQQAVQLDAPALMGKDGNQFNFIPEADALLHSKKNSPQGKSTALSTGFWNSSRSAYEVTSILRFDISALIAEVNSHPNKEIVSAHLHLFANTTDRIYQKRRNNAAPIGHSTLKGDNAFYVKAVHSNWDEHTTTWSQYYSNTNYTPSRIRVLPFAKVSGSANDNSLDYKIDLLELIKQCSKTNMRELTLELRLQRQPAMAEVAFYSKEAETGKQPTLTIKLQEK